MFLGIDHGTSAIRVGVLDGGGESSFSLPREMGAADEFFSRIDTGEVDLAVVTYSMGDALDSVKPIGEVENRGVVSREGAGGHVGAGTELFDRVRSAGLDAYVLPGLHRGLDVLHPAFRTYSHCASPEKLSVAFRASRRFGGDFSFSDVGSNTVTVGVRKGRVLGGIDAPVFAPGLEQGPLDVEAIRRVDAGNSTANGEFDAGGTDDLEALGTLVAMELRAVDLLVDGELALTGRAAPDVVERVEELVGKDVELLGEDSAALGGAEIAQAIHRGAGEVLGIPVDRR